MRAVSKSGQGYGTRGGILLALMAIAILAAGCGGGGGSGGGTGGGSGASDALVLIDMDVGGSDGVPLNKILRFEFAAPVDPETVRPDTIRIRKGPDFGHQVPGEYRVDGRIVSFYPRLPVLPDLSDAGLQPDTSYKVSLPGMPAVSTVRSVEDDRMRSTSSTVFRTSMLTASGLFQDNFFDPAPPTVVFMSPADGAVDVPADGEIVLTFNRRPLLPETVNTSNITLTMISRHGQPCHRVIPGALEMRQNFESIQILFHPTFPLADEATYELRVDRRVQDLMGNDVVPFQSMFTIRDEELRDGETVYDFTAAEKANDLDVDQTTASWDDKVPGALSALFTIAGGNGTAGDFAPTASVTIRPEDFPRGVTREVIDGVATDVYNFRSIDIPAGVTVRFAPSATDGNRPVRILALNDIRILGTIMVSGAHGADGETSSYSKSMSAATGGLAGPGGGDGATSYTGSERTSAPTKNGEDVEYGGGGGKGGGSGTYSDNRSSRTYEVSFAGGGGGGGSRLAGTAGKAGGYRYNKQFNGKGGNGGLATTERGYPENTERQPNVGGAGGGAGGKGYYYYSSSYYSTEYADTAGAGGGGGGAITVQGAGNVYFGSGARILADGGDGGSTSISSSYYGGAGGGGGGGSILVRATGQLEFAGPSVLSVAGGKGGGFAPSGTWSQGGQGGDGGHGYLRAEAGENENNPGKPDIAGLQTLQTTYSPVPDGIFAPQGGGAPSIGQTLWRNLGVFDPIMVKPAKGDVAATLLNDSMVIEVQMAVEDRNDIGQPDLGALDVTDSDSDGSAEDTLDTARLSEWTKISDIETLNGYGYQFIRVRVTFQLDDTQTADQPLPSLDRLTIRYRY